MRKAGSFWGCHPKKHSIGEVGLERSFSRVALKGVKRRFVGIGNFEQLVEIGHEAPHGHGSPDQDDDQGAARTCDPLSAMSHREPDGSSRKDDEPIEEGAGCFLNAAGPESGRADGLAPGAEVYLVIAHSREPNYHDAGRRGWNPPLTTWPLLEPAVRNGPDGEAHACRCTVQDRQSSALVRVIHHLG